MARVLPKDTLTWRLKLVESAAAYANSRLHAITAQVLILARFLSSLTNADCSSFVITVYTHVAH